MFFLPGFSVIWVKNHALPLYIYCVTAGLVNPVSVRLKRSGMSCVHTEDAARIIFIAPPAPERLLRYIIQFSRLGGKHNILLVIMYLITTALNVLTRNIFSRVYIVFII